MIRVSILVILVAGAVPATAQTAAPPAVAPTQAAGQPNPLDKIVCKNQETIGTRLGSHRVCATVREWQEQEAENRTAAEGMQGVGTGCPEKDIAYICK